jgi:hypothetical protein
MITENAAVLLSAASTSPSAKSSPWGLLPRSLALSRQALLRPQQSLHTKFSEEIGKVFFGVILQEVSTSMLLRCSEAHCISSGEGAVPDRGDPSTIEPWAIEAKIVDASPDFPPLRTCMCFAPRHRDAEFYGAAW